jgi:hypothetical protein
MFLAFSQEGDSLGVDVLLMPGKWLPMPPEGVYISKSVL